jgi:hypothetical protein
LLKKYLETKVPIPLIFTPGAGSTPLVRHGNLIRDGRLDCLKAGILPARQTWMWKNPPFLKIFFPKISLERRFRNSVFTLGKAKSRALPDQETGF